jgi:Zinc dependent phospholipase C
MSLTWLSMVTVAVLASILSLPRPATAYSVLAHQATVDSVWDAAIVPLLRQRFPGMTPERLRQARAFAYGGSVVQDLGYYPFGNRSFTDLTHYVRSGDFVEALIREARTADEFAFALGALAHYNADTSGHAIAINRAVALIYPKLRAKHGNEVTYAESPGRHVMVEFAFDVVHVAAGAYLPDAYRAFVGFEVSKEVLERAFAATYGLGLKELFIDLDLAIGTYRYAIGRLIPEVTRVAWREKRKEIERLTPDVQRNRFVYSLTRHEYEQRFGTRYRRPGMLVRVVTFLFKLLPKVGPLRPLAFKTPTPEAERLFADSCTTVRERYRAALVTLRAGGSVELQNADFDTGQPSRYGEYPLADETYAELLEKLASRRFAGMPPALRRDIERFYAGFEARMPATRKEQRQAEKVSEQLAMLRGER